MSQKNQYGYFKPAKDRPAMGEDKETNLDAIRDMLMEWSQECRALYTSKRVGLTEETRERFFELGVQILQLRRKI